MSVFNNIPNKLITDTDGNKHWISPSVSVDALLVIKGFVLIVKRSEKMSNPNKWCLPCGFIDFNEDLLNASIRELHEETNVDIREHDIINSDYHRPYNLNGTAVQFIFELEKIPLVSLNYDECSQHQWIDISKISNSDLEFAFGHDKLICYLLDT